MFRLRPAAMNDAALLLDWRNDPATRMASVNTSEVSLADHLRWLEVSLSNIGRHLLIAEHEGVPVGTVRIDFGPPETELSWTVGPQHRGKKIGTAMVMAAMPDGRIIARIKIDNIASQRIAAQAGFFLSSTGDDTLQTWIRG